MYCVRIQFLCYMDLCWSHNFFCRIVKFIWKKNPVNRQTKKEWEIEKEKLSWKIFIMLENNFKSGFEVLIIIFVIS